jgi:hypothetical protein
MLKLKNNKDPWFKNIKKNELFNEDPTILKNIEILKNKYFKNPNYINFIIMYIPIILFALFILFAK